MGQSTSWTSWLKMVACVFFSFPFYLQGVTLRYRWPEVTSKARLQGDSAVSKCKRRRRRRRRRKKEKEKEEEEEASESVTKGLMCNETREVISIVHTLSHSLSYLQFILNLLDVSSYWRACGSGISSLYSSNVSWEGKRKREEERVWKIHSRVKVNSVAPDLLCYTHVDMHTGQIYLVLCSRRQDLTCTNGTNRSSSKDF